MPEKPSSIFSQYNGLLIFNPPKKIGVKMYKCDKKFHIDSIIEMYVEKEINYGIALVSGKEFRYYLVTITGNHKDIKFLESDDIMLQKRMRRGGMSSSRIRRIGDLKELHYVKDMGEMLVKTFMVKKNTKCLINKLIIAGTSDIKNKVIQNETTQKYFSKIISSFACSEITDNTINEVYYKCKNMFITMNDIETKEIMDEVSDLIINNPDKLVFGIDEIILELKNNNIEKLIIDKDMKDKNKLLNYSGKK